MIVFIAYSNQAAVGIRGHDYAHISEFVDTITRVRKLCNAVHAQKRI